MRRRVPLLALLLAALLTGSAVVAGVVVLTREPAPAPAAVTLVLDDTSRPATVDGADVRARPAARRGAEVGRSGVGSDQGPEGAGNARPAAGAGLRTIAPYRVHPAPDTVQRKPVRLREEVEEALAAEPEDELAVAAPTVGTPFTFQVGTLNVQGSQHRPNGPGRAGMHVSTILGRGVDLVGFQEVQDDQLAVLNGRLAGWTIWPSQALGNQGVRLQIGWRDDLFSLMGTGSITTTFDHQRRPIPWVLLRHTATGGEFYVIDVHNSPRDQEADRDSATVAEIALVRQLQATGKPVLLLGDTNESTEFGCKVSAATGMVGSNGATPASCVGAGPIKIDKILGTGGQVAFSGHVVDYAPPVRAATDHAFVRATVTISP